MKYKFSEEQYEAIKKARKQNRDKQIDKRLQVLELRCEGKGLDEIASITEFHRSHVSNLLAITERDLARGAAERSEPPPQPSPHYNKRRGRATGRRKTPGI